MIGYVRRIEPLSNTTTISQLHSPLNQIHIMVSMRESRRVLEMVDGAFPPNLNIDSITDSSAEVVVKPVKPIQSFTHDPAP